jgi:hypothetical protein
MKEDARDPVEVLKEELRLLQSGYYERLNREQWRPAMIFEDSPSCLNYTTPDERGQCEGCILMPFVPTEKRRERIPCRHIALTPEGETLESLYRSCEMEEVHKAAADWLRRTIADLERQREIYNQVDRRSSKGRGGGPRAIPLYECAEPKCANSECSSTFHWLAQGELFRFPVGREQAGMGGVHQVRHYWLCEGCRKRYGLVGDAVWGAVLRHRLLSNRTMGLSMDRL